MVATFDLNLPTARDRMRFALGDTNVAAALEQDETYAATLTLHGEPLGTAVMAEALAARFAQEPDSVGIDGALSVSWRDRVKTWLALAQRIRTELVVGSGIAGAIAGTRGTATTSEYVRSAGGTWWTG